MLPPSSTKNVYIMPNLTHDRFPSNEALTKETMLLWDHYTAIYNKHKLIVTFTNQLSTLHSFEPE